MKHYILSAILGLCSLIFAPTLPAAQVAVAPTTAHAKAIRAEVEAALRATVSVWLSPATSPQGQERRRHDLIQAATSLLDAQARATAFGIKIDPKQEAALAEAMRQMEQTLGKNPEATKEELFGAFAKGLILGYASKL